MGSNSPLVAVVAGRTAVTGGEMEPECERNPTDTLLEALADEQRRYVVAYLSDASGEVAPVSELACYVKKRCSETHDREQVEPALHYNGLPKLEEAGILEYDARSKTGRYHPDSKVEGLLDCLKEQVGR